MSTILFVLLSVKKKISEKEVTIQGSQSLLCFKPLSKELIISLNRNGDKNVTDFATQFMVSSTISRVQFLEKCVCVCVRTGRISAVL